MARGVILSGDYLLVAHCKGMENTFLPGGHVEFREGIRETLSRELKEELGVESDVGEYIGAVEAEFDHEIYHQEINHLFLTILPNYDHSIHPISEEAHLEFFWIHKNDFETHNLQPYPVRNIIRSHIEGNKGPFWLSTFENK